MQEIRDRLKNNNGMAQDHVDLINGLKALVSKVFRHENILAQFIKPLNLKQSELFYYLETQSKE